MVNLLEGLYALTAGAFLMALVLFVRGRRALAGRFAIAGTIGAVAAIALYWYLSPAA